MANKLFRFFYTPGAPGSDQFVTELERLKEKSASEYAVEHIDISSDEASKKYPHVCVTPSLERIFPSPSSKFLGGLDELSSWLDE